ncbi:protein of unknown function [Tenacibaculum sp. 190524A02b]|uniref:hypothetical protein n=1 Tax=Tenacibaculum vairaonense TaxID=3137860 RepID=UPI0032B2EDC6
MKNNPKTVEFFFNRFKRAFDNASNKVSDITKIDIDLMLICNAPLKESSKFQDKYRIMCFKYLERFK